MMPAQRAQAEVTKQGQNCKLSHEASTARQIDAVMPMPSKPGPNWPARSHGKCCRAKVKHICEMKTTQG